MKKTSALILLSALFLVFFSAESSQQDAIVGVLLPLSGPQASAGFDVRNGTEMAAEIINGNYYIDLPLARGEGLPSLEGTRIRLVFADDAGNASRGAKEAERLIEEGAVAIFGSYSSDVTSSASEVAESHSVPFICPLSAASELTERRLKWFFRTGPATKQNAETLFEFLDRMRSQDSNAKNIAVLSINNSWGRDFSRQVQIQADKRGYEVVAKVSYELGDPDLTKETLQLKSAGEAVLLQASYPDDAVLSLQTYKRLNYAPLAILACDAGFVAPEFIPTLGKDAEYVMSRDAWSQDAEKPVARQISEIYKSRYKMNMTDISARAFTGLIVLAGALDRAGSTDPELLHAALEETDLSSEEVILPWNGVKFDRAHQNTLCRGIVLQVQGGRYRTVWPPELARANLVWPFPGWNG
jgi:branched-chain amino acid transport system substrate-binding protein